MVRYVGMDGFLLDEVELDSRISRWGICLKDDAEVVSVQVDGHKSNKFDFL